MQLPIWYLHMSLLLRDRFSRGPDRVLLAVYCVGWAVSFLGRAFSTSAKSQIPKGPSAHPSCLDYKYSPAVIFRPKGIMSFFPKRESIFDPSPHLISKARRPVRSSILVGKFWKIRRNLLKKFQHSPLTRWFDGLLITPATRVPGGGGA